MKKIIFILFIVIGASTQVNAQDGEAVVHKHALGARLTGGYYFSPEISYQMGLTNRNRLEFDAGGRFYVNYTRLLATIVFHWDFNIMSGWNWFIGPGVQLGTYIDHLNPSNNSFPIGVGGQVGMEFDFNVFDVPLVAGVDTRPMFDVFGHPSGFGIYVPTAAVSARYTFKN